MELYIKPTKNLINNNLRHTETILFKSRTL